MSESTFRGEDENAGAAHPALDLVAGLFLLAIGVWFAAMAISLSVPGRPPTAPGLLPFLTAASLAAMALVLGFSALRQLRTAAPLGLTLALFGVESRRRILLAFTIIVYVAALDVLSFETYLHIADYPVPLGSFEPVTVVALTTMLRLFWTPRLAHCVLVAVVWTAMLSVMFRGVFNIPMPG